MLCNTDCIEKVLKLGLPSNLADVEGVISFYCKLGFWPEEIVAEISFAIELADVLEALRNEGVELDAETRKEISNMLRNYPKREVLARYGRKKKTPKP